MGAPRLGFRAAAGVALSLALLSGCGRTPRPPVVPDEPAKQEEEAPREQVNAGEPGKRRPPDRVVQPDGPAGPAQLARRVGDDTAASPEEKAAALAALKAVAPELIDEALWNALRSRNPRVRSWALEEMKQRDEDDHLNEVLARALADDNPDVRREAAEALHQRRAAALAAALARRVADDRFANDAEKDAALAALVALAPDRVNAALAEAEKSANAKVKEWAARARVKVAAAGVPPRPRRPAGPPPLERDWLGTGERVNLLRLAGVKLTATTALGDEADGLKHLTDGDPATVAVATPTVAGLDVVYELASVGAPEAVLVRLPANNPPGAATGRVEVLVSTVSAHVGFQALCTVALKPGAATQRFSFTPAAARWVRLRFHPEERTGRVAVAEVGVLGLAGPPRTRYGFKESPAKALDLLARLKANAAVKRAVRDDEAALLADVQEGRFRTWTFAEAALLASGVTDAERRKGYAARIDALEKEAKAAVAGAKMPFEKGALLLRFVHTGPLSGGYRGGQTDLHTILESKTFNCVSSAVLYNVLALRLGLDARAIEVPDHAFSIVYDGTRHADVETTVAVGFELDRDRAARRQFRSRTGFIYVPDRYPEKRRELREAGLVALIFYNHAVAALQQGRSEEALFGFFKALSLDAEDALSVQMALAALAAWSGDLVGKGRFDDALAVLATGLDLAPRDATLLYQRRTAWARWALATLREGKDDEALALLARAARAVPEDADLFRRLMAYVPIRKGEELVKAGKWDEALALVGPALDQLEGPGKEELRAWAVSLSLRRAQYEFAAGRFEQAAAALAQGRAREPGNERLGHYLAYVVQEWVARVERTDGSGKAEALLADLLKRHADVPEVKRGANGYLLSRVLNLVQTEKFAEAAAYVEKRASLFQGKPDARAVTVAVYDRWAESLLRRKDWAAAAERYGEALKRYPTDDHLRHNARAVWDAWAGSHIDSQDWPAAVEVYAKALAQLPDDRHVLNNLAFVVHRHVKATAATQGKDAAGKLLAAMQKRFPKLPGADLVLVQVRDLANANRFEEALDLLDGGSDLVTDRARLREVAVRLFERWAGRRLEAKDWPGAVEVYQKGLKRFPDEPRLMGAVTRVLQAAAKDKSEGAEAVAKRRAVMQELLARDPTLTEKLRADLKAKDPKTRKGAAEGLHALGAASAADALAERVADGVWYRSGYRNVPSDPEAGGKAAALAALRELAPERVTAALVKAAVSKSPATRSWALVELAKQKDAVGNKEVGDVMVKALVDAPAGSDELIELVLAERHPRRAAAQGLQQLKMTAAADALAKRVADDVWYVSGYTNVPSDPEGGGKAAALRALSELAPDRVGPALGKAAKSKTLAVRQWAVRQLVQRKDPSAVAVLCQRLGDAEPKVRKEAAELLEGTTDRSAVKPLVDRVADGVWYVSGYSNVPDDPEGGGKGAALKALRGLDAAEATKALLRAAAAKKVEVRGWALSELVKEPRAAASAEIVKALEAGLRERDCTVRMVRKKAHPSVVAADGLRTLKAKGSAGALAERVADDVWYVSGYSNVPSDPEGGGKAAALRALVELAPDQVKPALEKAAKSKTEAVRRWAEAELKKLKPAGGG
jgi:tetratricopeptide (TPR) repeat protein